MKHFRSWCYHVQELYLWCFDHNRWYGLDKIAMARVGFNVTQSHVDRDCTGSYGEVVVCHPQQGCISSSKNGVVQRRFGGESGEEEDQIAVGNAERDGGGGGGGELVGEYQEKNLEQHLGCTSVALNKEHV